MIGNKYLQTFYEYGDPDTGLNQLLELLKFQDKDLINSLNQSVDLAACTVDEKKFLTIASALIDYSLQEHGLTVPQWLRDKQLRFDRPSYYPKRISDFEKFRLQYSNPSPFRIRNVYFDLSGISRV